MKFSKIVLSVVFAIIFSNIAYCDTLYKEQTVINQQKNIIEYISSDGNTTHKTLEKNSFFVDKNGSDNTCFIENRMSLPKSFFLL